jgi:multiple sugar transport system substrate-binding protein
MTVVLRGMTWEHERGHGSVAAAAEAYRAVDPGVEVRWEFRSLQAFADHPIDTLARDYDLLVIDHPHIPIAAEDGLFARLDGRGHDDELALLAAASVGRSHSSYEHGGHQYGLATDAAAQVAVYRADLLAEPPRGWPAVLALARAGRVLWPAKPIDAFSSLVTIAATHGTPPMETAGDFMTHEAAAPVLAIMHELASLVPAWNLDANPIEVADALSGGDEHWYAPLAFGYSNYSRAGFRSHRLTYTDIPGATNGVVGSLLGGAGIAVSAFSRHQEEAVAHAFWLASPDVQAGVYYDGGGQPGHAAAWESDRTNADSLDFFRGTRRTLEGAYVRPRTRGYIEFQDEVSPLVTATLRGELSDRDLVDRANALAALLLMED